MTSTPVIKTSTPIETPTPVVDDSDSDDEVKLNFSEELKMLKEQALNLNSNNYDQQLEQLNQKAEDFISSSNYEKVKEMSGSFETLKLKKETMDNQIKNMTVDELKEFLKPRKQVREIKTSVPKFQVTDTPKPRTQRKQVREQVTDTPKPRTQVTDTPKPRTQRKQVREQVTDTPLPRTQRKQVREQVTDTPLPRTQATDTPTLKPSKLTGIAKIRAEQKRRKQLGL